MFPNKIFYSFSRLGNYIKNITDYNQLLEIQNDPNSLKQYIDEPQQSLVTNISATITNESGKTNVVLQIFVTFSNNIINSQNVETMVPLTDVPSSLIK